MAERDLVAAEFFCLAVQMPSPHAGAEVAGRVFLVICDIKDIRLKYRERNLKQLRVAFNFLTVDRIVTRIHAEKNEIKGYAGMFVQLLHEFRHQHAVFAAGDADCDLGSRLDELVLDDGRHDRGPEFFAEALVYAALDELAAGEGSCHGVSLDNSCK